MMMGPALAFNQPGLERSCPATSTASRRGWRRPRRPPPTPELPKLEAPARRGPLLPRAEGGVRHTLPERHLHRPADALPRRARRSQVLHYDRAVTPGDAFLYLPTEKIVITGDLLVNPVSFALSCYPDRLAEDAREDRRARRDGASCPGTASRCTTRRCSTPRWTCSASCCGRARTRRARGLDRGSGEGGDPAAPARPDGDDHAGRSGAERGVPDPPRRLVLCTASTTS